MEFLLWRRKSRILYDYAKAAVIMGTFLKYLKQQPLVTAILAIVPGILSVRVLPCTEFLQIGILRMVLCAAMLFALYLISGEKSLGTEDGNDAGSTGYVLRLLSGFLIFSLVLGLFVFFAQPQEAVAGWPVNLLTMFFMYVFSGLFEELAFRAVLNDAIVRRFRTNPHVFVISAVVTSLLFGAAHIIGTEITNFTALLTAVMKTISTGVIGLAFLLSYWKTRNIWAIGLVHGMYDFFVSFSLAFAGSTLTVDYVSPDAKAGTIILYAALICVELLMVWRIWGKVRREIDFEEMRQNW